MSELSKRVNEFFKYSTKSEIEEVKNQIYITKHLESVMNMFYKEKRDIDYIAFKTGYSRGKIEADLRLIRNKLKKLI